MGSLIRALDIVAYFTRLYWRKLRGALPLLVLLVHTAPAWAQYTSSGLTYSDGIEPGDPSVCEAPGGNTCYWVDCDAVSDGTGTYASPFWGFENVFGYYNSGSSYILGASTVAGGDYVYIKGTCEVTGSTDTATGPYKQIKIGRVAQLGTSSEPTVIKSWRGTAQATFDGEYDSTLSPAAQYSSNEPTELISVNPTVSGGYIKFQNIKIYRAYAAGIRVNTNVTGSKVESVTFQEGRVDQTGTNGQLARNCNSASVVCDDYFYNNWFKDNDSICNTYGGDPDSDCTLSNNDGSLTITAESYTNASSVINIYNNLFENNAKAVHQKHNGNLRVNIYENSFDTATKLLHLRDKDTHFYYNIVRNVSDAVFEHDVESESVGVGITAYNNSIYIPTGGKLLGDNVIYTSNGTFVFYNNAVESASTTTPFITLGAFIGETFDPADWTSDHNFFYVPGAVQTTFSCLGPTVSGTTCTNRSFSSTMTYLSDASTSVTDPSFTDAAGGDFEISGAALTASRTGSWIGAQEPGSGGPTPTPSPSPTPPPTIAAANVFSRRIR